MSYKTKSVHDTPVSSPPAHGDDPPKIQQELLAELDDLYKRWQSASIHTDVAARMFAKMVTLLRARNPGEADG